MNICVGVLKYIKFSVFRPRANFRDAGEAENQRLVTCGGDGRSGASNPATTARSQSRTARFGFARVSVASVSKINPHGIHALPFHM